MNLFLLILLSFGLASYGGPNGPDQEDAAQKAKTAADLSKSMQAESMSMAAIEMVTGQFDKAAMHIQQFQEGQKSQNKNDFRETHAVKDVTVQGAHLKATTPEFGARPSGKSVSGTSAKQPTVQSSVQSGVAAAVQTAVQTPSEIPVLPVSSEQAAAPEQSTATENLPKAEVVESVSRTVIDEKAEVVASEPPVLEQAAVIAEPTNPENVELATTTTNETAQAITLPTEGFAAPVTQRETLSDDFFSTKKRVLDPLEAEAVERRGRDGALLNKVRNLVFPN